MQRASAMLGQSIGSYQITGKLSEGGMGTVYRGEHALLGRAAAIKMLLPAMSRDRDLVQRFFNEARITSSIRHPSIVEIFDFGYHEDGQAYLIMELLAGEPLSRRLARGGVLDEATVIGLARSIASALAAAHARGVIHRDLKPDNIFLVPDPDVPAGDRPKLLDFGIAKLAEMRGTPSATRTGMMLGTPAYMSPEQCRGTGWVDARADLYGLGCVLYECVAGHPPFVAQGDGELIGAHLHVAPQPLREVAPSASAQLEDLVARLLAKDPADRPPSAIAVADELARLAPYADAAAWYGTPTPPPFTSGVHPVPTTLGGAAGATPTRRPTPASTRTARRGGVVARVVLAVAGAAALGFAAVTTSMHIARETGENVRPAAAPAPDAAPDGAPVTSVPAAPGDGS